MTGPRGASEGRRGALRSARLPAAAALLAVLSACGSGQSAATSEPGPTSSVVTASPAPAAARAHTAEGAQAAAAHYLGQAAVAWQTADPAVIASLATPACQECQRYVDAAAGLARAKRRHSERTTSVQVTGLPGATADVVMVSANVRRGAATVVDADDQLVDLVGDENDVLTVALHWVEGRWLVDSIDAGHRLPYPGQPGWSRPNQLRPLQTSPPSETMRSRPTYTHIPHVRSRVRW